MLISLVILGVAAASASAVNTSARFGMVFGVGFVNSPSITNIIDEIDKGVNFKPGFEFGMKVNRIGFGISSLFMFNKTESAYPNLNWDWTFDWISTINIGYHFARRWYLLDPFIEAGFGAAGRVDLIPYFESMEHMSCLAAGNLNCPDYKNLSGLSLVGYIAAGLSLRLDMLYISGKLSYWPLNSPPPATQFMPYPLKQFQFAVSAGFVLGK